MAYSSGTVTASSLTKEVYNPKAFFLHAALLGQACAHCPIFPTAASRRSLGRVSVPMWPVNLSVRLLIVALVGVTCQLANQTRGHLRAINLWQSEPCDPTASCGISTNFSVLFPSPRQVPHALLTRPPLRIPIRCPKLRQGSSVRLACVKHAASVHPEPGSNSQ